ncbi:hypothetical protein UFOVP4_6 [uncultured Caudovirales phage]|uniref:N-acetyltransferase domain-containing protein n=1 Tax=uncultured Caudovirales phage TaxID=2100421 RepID=A0A6J7VQ58_9CAUD|nr:hypothetical protein UFOVP4_6 [uncultured Caudovirales phage]CAB4241351.1 hypothetical protein UFOVP64_53 [uncultured Caudovirales phage]CAB5078968.1 hypothetical protein UFOVP145_9 [uncultured Caudovirales phage]
MQLSDLDRNAVAYVIENMRDWDRQEIFATRPDYDEGDSLLESVLAAGPVSWIAWHDGEPIAVFGCMPLWRGVWSMWFFATNSLPKIGIGVTKLVTRYIVPMLWEGGAHRLECRSMEGHVDAQRWLEVIGAHREGSLVGYGRDGQDFHVYAWRKP